MTIESVLKKNIDSYCSRNEISLSDNQINKLIDLFSSTKDENNRKLIVNRGKNRKLDGKNSCWDEDVSFEWEIFSIYIYVELCAGNCFSAHFHFKAMIDDVPVAERDYTVDCNEPSIGWTFDIIGQLYVEVGVRGHNTCAFTLGYLSVPILGKVLEWDENIICFSRNTANQPRFVQ
ncbi:MAG: hypothetical protein F6K22_30185 [Okeania sp. SIO2F4]|uniref:hypothetical protein n=1 Tax=Okeania sp. SIO2F4 TaxID=2607790 RepID=UPI001429BB32|nr:hypothetical protein [Okeania sp. SIO2F4]NES06714.1 hypothetical protein [Okeania sp. SIO2F4]